MDWEMVIIRMLEQNANEHGMLSWILPGGFTWQYCHQTPISNRGTPGNPAVEAASSPSSGMSSFSLCFIPADFYFIMLLSHVTVKSNQVTIFFLQEVILFPSHSLHFNSDYSKVKLSSLLAVVEFRLLLHLWRKRLLLPSKSIHIFSPVLLNFFWLWDKSHFYQQTGNWTHFTNQSLQKSVPFSSWYDRSFMSLFKSKGDFCSGQS